MWLVGLVPQKVCKVQSSTRCIGIQCIQADLES